jgi:hypothetical protein
VRVQNAVFLKEHSPCSASAAALDHLCKRGCKRIGKLRKLRRCEQLPGNENFRKRNAVSQLNPKIKTEATIRAKATMSFRSVTQADIRRFKWNARQKINLMGCLPIE